MVKFEVGDTVMVAVSWDRQNCPPVGSVATITEVELGGTCRLKWEGKFPQFDSRSLFGMTPWFEKVGGPW